MSAIENLSTTWILFYILLLAVGTYALRYSFVGFISHFDMPNRVERNLDLIPPAVLAALAVPPLIFRDGVYHLSPLDPFLLSGIVAGFVAWRTESLGATIATGFVVFFVRTYIPIF